MKRLPLITSFVLFIALCASIAYWAMQLLKPPQRIVAAAAQMTLPAPRLESAVSLLGGRSSFAVASNYQLKGVIVSSDPADSVALLSTNGKPAQAIRTNREVMPGTTVREVQRDHVLLLEGGIVKRVDMPASSKQQMTAATPDHTAYARPTPSVAPTSGSPRGRDRSNNQRQRGTMEASRNQRSPPPGDNVPARGR